MLDAGPASTPDERYLDVVAVRKSFKGVTVMDGMNFRMATPSL